MTSKAGRENGCYKEDKWITFVAPERMGYVRRETLDTITDFLKLNKKT